MLSTLRLHRLVLLILFLTVFITAWLYRPVAAAARCFGETNVCIDGRFAQFWEQQGGLAVFGLPISAAAVDGQRQAQHFERNSFELHPQNTAPYDVLLGRLGDDRLKQQGRDWQAFSKADTTASHFFTVTGHAIAHEPFWRYWSSHGLELGDPGVSERESLALFGYPLSEPMVETNASGDTVLTQWFERARFEDHGPKGVLLGLLGSEIRNGADKTTISAINPVRLAWFYKPPTDSTSAATLAQHVNDFILTHRDEQFRDKLLATGVPRDDILQYIMGNEIHDPGSCSSQPWGNQFAFKSGDFCRLVRDHPDWFLHDRNGQRICYNNKGERFCMMDPGHSGWRRFAVERTRELHDRWGWYGVFLDNIDGSLARADDNTRQYRDDATYQRAIEGFLTYLQDNYFEPEKRPLYANLTERRDDTVWYRYIRLLDGAMDEGCIVGWRGDYGKASDWAEHLERLEKTQALNKTVLCVAQGTSGDREHQEFAFASYLLVANGQATFRYTNRRNYDEFWHYTNYEWDLGLPRGGRFRVGNGWQRDFERGSVFVDPQAQIASITRR